MTSQIEKVSKDTIGRWKAKLPVSMPNSPTNAGYSSALIKRLLSTSVITDEENSVFSELNRIIDEANKVFENYFTKEELSESITTKVLKVTEEYYISGFKSFEALTIGDLTIRNSVDFSAKDAFATFTSPDSIQFTDETGYANLKLWLDHMSEEAQDYSEAAVYQSKQYSDERLEEAKAYAQNLAAGMSKGYAISLSSFNSSFDKNTETINYEQNSVGDDTFCISYKGNAFLDPNGSDPNKYIYLSNLKVGDVLYFTDLNTPDYWVSNNISIGLTRLIFFHKLETKTDFTNYYTKPEVESLIDIEKERATNAEETKQDKLISGTNIKTIQGYSLLGNGNLKILGSYIFSGSLMQNAYAEYVIQSGEYETGQGYYNYFGDEQVDTKLRGSLSHLPYNGEDLAFLSEIPTDYATKEELQALSNLIGTLNDNLEDALNGN